MIYFKRVLFFINHVFLLRSGKYMQKKVHFCVKDTDNCYHSYSAKMISTGECVAASRLE